MVKGFESIGYTVGHKVMSGLIMVFHKREKEYFSFVSEMIFPRQTWN